jgi:hypothetical protein
MRLFRIKIWRVMLAVAGIAVLLWWSVQAWRWHQLLEFKKQCVFQDFADLTKDYGDYTNVSLDQSPCLRDVVEPITLIESEHAAGSDQVWTGVVFADSKQVRRYAEFIDVRIEISETLMLGKKMVPPRGAEERAFIGLLQRWYRQDAEAREFNDHLKRSDFFGLNAKQKAKVRGIVILRKLLKRD